jgi:hypothetical protein
MKKHLMILTGAAVITAGALSSFAQTNPFLGKWALTIPDAGAGWLEIKEAPGGYLDGSILWVAGSVVPLDSVLISEGREGNQTLPVVRINEVERKDAQGKVVASRNPRNHHGLHGRFYRFLQYDPDRPQAGRKGITMSQLTAQRIHRFPGTGLKIL